MQVGEEVIFESDVTGLKYNVTRLSDNEWKVTQWALMICLNSLHLSSPNQVINFLSSSFK